MARALELAKSCEIFARPNPGVGCVLVDGDRIVAEGATAASGRPHAEVIALTAVGGRAAGAVAYITLEPCCHHGKSPPCTDALIKAGVGDVFVGALDPNPLVAGRGVEALAAAGIRVRTGLLQADVNQLNRGFTKRMLKGRPRVVLKIAASLDGATAMARGESQWITGEAARADGQALRASVGAILTGAGTVLADDPALTVRDPRFAELPAQPLRVVLDSRLRTPPDATVYRGEGSSVVYCAETTATSHFSVSSAEVMPVAVGQDSRPSLNEVLDDLGRREINDVMIEAGAELNGRFVEECLVDEYVFYLAPKLLGDRTRGLFVTPNIQTLADAHELEIIDVAEIGRDLRIRARPET